MEILNSRTIIRPGDLERSICFYRDALGLGIAREFGTGADRGVVFFLGGGLLEVVDVNNSASSNPLPPIPNPMMALWLQVRDIHASMTELGARGVAIVRPPKLEPWGLIEAWVVDPDGIRIHFVEVPADHPLRRDQRVL